MGRSTRKVLSQIHACEKVEETNRKGEKGN